MIGPNWARHSFGDTGVIVPPEQIESNINRYCPHNERGNIGFADGHADAIKWHDLRDDTDMWKRVQ